MNYAYLICNAFHSLTRFFNFLVGGVNFQRGNGNQPRMKLWKNNLNFVYSVLTVCTETLVA